MSKIEKIKRYIERTKFKSNMLNYDLCLDEWLAFCNMPDVLDAFALAFNYGQAKGYRAAKAEVRCEQAN